MGKMLARRVSLSIVLVFAISVLFTGCIGSLKFSGKNPAKDRNSTNNSSTVNEKPGTGTQKDAKDGEGNQDIGSSSTAGEENSGLPNTGGNENGDAGDDSDKNTEAAKPPVKVKALYLTGWTVGSAAKVDHFVELARTTELNSYVIDIKDDDGYVGYESQIPAVREIGAWKKKYDADKVLKAFHDGGVHIIGRIVCFKDPVLSSKKPDLAVKSTNGGLWRDNKKLTWLNPYDRDAWPYLIEIAREATEKGFDEIQFDYIRFPNDGSKKTMDFGSSALKKFEIINEFLAYARKELPGVVLSADVFGIICESPGDTEDIGQYLELIGKDIDYISPMAYPSHYAAGQVVNKVRFAKPDLDPYSVVYNSLAKAKDRISKAEGYKAKMRPYLQDFTATWLGKGYYQTYGPEQVRQQIKAVYDAGYDEWILWDAANTYSEPALLKEVK